MHPKYTLVYIKEYNGRSPYVIMEHISNDQGIMSREFCKFDNITSAMTELGYLSKGPVLIASSNQPIDNIFEV